MLNFRGISLKRTCLRQRRAKNLIASYSSTITLKFVLYDFLKFYLSENHHAAAYNVVTSWTLNHVPPHGVLALLQALIGLWPVL